MTGALLWATAHGAAGILALVRDDDFTDPRCRFVVSTIRRMTAEAVPVDRLTVAAYVTTHALLEPGPARRHLAEELHALAESAPVPASGTWYAAILIEHTARNAGIRAGRRLAALAEGADLDDYRAGVRAELLAVLDALDRCTTKAEVVTR